MGSFLSIGECMIEMADLGDGRYARGVAGDTLNTAWYARHALPADWSVAYGTRIGTDTASQGVFDFIQAAGIETHWIGRDSHRSVGLYLTTLTAGERRFSYWRGQSAARHLANDADFLRSMMTGQDIIYFSGISLAILAPDDRKRLCDCLASARQAGSCIAFDTNVRAQLWSNADDMRAGIALGASVSDIVFPSHDDEMLMYPDQSIWGILDRYRAAGARTVVMKNGPQPVWCDHLGQRFSHNVMTISDVVDTTAAGDSFAAGFLASVVQGDDPKQAVQSAVALSAQVVRSHGALVVPVLDV